MSVVNERATPILATHALVTLVSLLPQTGSRHFHNAYRPHVRSPPAYKRETKLVSSDGSVQRMEKKGKRRKTRLAGIGPRFDRSAHSALNGPPVFSRAANRRRFDFLR